MSIQTYCFLLKKYTSKTSQLIKIVKDTLVLPMENSKLRQNCEDGNQKDGEKKTNTTKWLLVALLIQICCFICEKPNNLSKFTVYHRDKTGAQNRLSPKSFPLDSPELSGTCFINPCESDNG